MARPFKIVEPTKTYNLLLKTEQYDRLAVVSSKMQKTSREQVAVAALIRAAIDVYLAALEDEVDSDLPDER